MPFLQLLTGLLLLAQLSFSQQDSANPKIGILTPLYLDSAFDASMNYRYGSNFPKFINPGLEFYEGIQLAIDSLEAEGVKLDVQIIDTRAAGTSLSKLTSGPEFQDLDLVIGHVTGSEARTLADAAAKNNIPFINVNYPNDAGITNNPNYIVLNSTLSTHCAALYKFLQRNYATSDIIFLRKKGTQEDRLVDYFKEIEKSTSSVPLKLKYLTLEDNTMGPQLLKNLDSTKTNVFIAGSLDLNFANNLLQTISGFGESYAVTVFGMPNWDGMELPKTLTSSLEVVYGTPFYINPADKTAENILQYFKTRFYSRPSDMVYRGFETLYHFGHLLVLHGNNMGSSLSDKRFRVFADFDIQPVLNKKDMTLDYFENRKIYFVKKSGGVVRAVY